VNLPAEELNSQSRLGFQFEQAFWFYEDFYRTADPQRLPKLTLKSFGERLMKHCPVHISLIGKDGVAGFIDEFYEYKAHVPTCGAIILNDDLNKCLMVRGFSSKSTWGFPKGKIAKDEMPSACAVREVYEETGFDAGPYLHEESFIQVANNEQPIRLYIIPSIPESTHFAPLTRREIRDIQWHPVKDFKWEKGGPHRYFNVMPFIGRLRQWIKRYRRQHGQTVEDEFELERPLEMGPECKPLEVEPVCRDLMERVKLKLVPLTMFILDINSLKVSFSKNYKCA
jgi:8-oxo-dGTP pyrophosphatase MutT (NUDIX family)